MNSLSNVTLILFLLLLHLFSATPCSATCPSEAHFAIGSYTAQPWLPTAAGAGITLAHLAADTLTTTAIFAPPISGDNPSFLSASPPHIYAASENAPNGSLTQITISPNLPFLRASSRDTLTAGTTHVTAILNDAPEYANLSTRRLILTANYGGSVTSFTKSSAAFMLASLFAIPPELASSKRNGNTATEAQKEPHPHMVLPYKRGIIVPDLGSDLVWYLSLDRESGALAEISRVELMGGDGPRHAAVHERSGTVYVVTEFSQDLVVLQEGKCGSKGLGVCERRALVEEKSEGGAAAAVRVSPDGRFVYASVRREEEEGVIVGFEVDGERGSVVRKVGEWGSGGEHPRDFLLVGEVMVGDKCMSCAAVVNRDSDNLVMMGRDEEIGIMRGEALFEMEVKTPTLVMML